VVALGFDATGSLLHSADWREVATWAIERKAGGTGSTAERSCELAGRNMKLDEWRRYFGDQPYRRTCPFPVAEEVIGGLDEDGVRAALRGDRAAAGAIFRNAADLARDVAESDDSVLNDLCWHGSVAGFASTVLNACELAVRYSNGSTGHRDSRGLARALTGNRRGAIEDFEAFVADRNHSEERRRERVQWIADLKAGRNPFDKATLERIRDQ
jgi:hypothetical protein